MKHQSKRNNKRTVFLLRRKPIRSQSIFLQTHKVDYCHDFGSAMLDPTPSPQIASEGSASSPRSSSCTRAPLGSIWDTDGLSTGPRRPRGGRGCLAYGHRRWALRRAELLGASDLTWTVAMAELRSTRACLRGRLDVDADESGHGHLFSTHNRDGGRRSTLICCRDTGASGGYSGTPHYGDVMHELSAMNRPTALVSAHVLHRQSQLLYICMYYAEFIYFAHYLVSIKVEILGSTAMLLILSMYIIIIFL